MGSGNGKGNGEATDDDEDEGEDEDEDIIQIGCYVFDIGINGITPKHGWYITSESQWVHSLTMLRDDNPEQRYNEVSNQYIILQRYKQKQEHKLPD